MWRRLLRMLLLAIAVLSIPVLAFVIVMITVVINDATRSIVPLLAIILATLANTSPTGGIAGPWPPAASPDTSGVSRSPW